ncbi:cytochrome P450 2C14 isoform X2 [Pogona vitticeps]
MEVVQAGPLLLFCLLISIIFLSIKMHKKKSQLPPGPTPLLFLGNFLQKDVLPINKHYPKLVKKYGPVFTVWPGLNPVVVLCGYKTVKEALVDHAKEFDSRPVNTIGYQLTKGYGLTSNNESRWRTLRQFTLSTLRDFGMGKKTMSKKVQEEAVCLVDEIATTEGQAFDLRSIIASAASNVICSVVFGNRFDYQDKHFQELLCILDNYMYFHRSFLGVVYSFIPQIMNYLPGRHKKIFADCEKLCAFIRGKVESHKENLDPQNPSDYIDCFLLRSEKEHNSPEDVFGQENLAACVFQLFVAGSGTVSFALLSLLLLMAKLPHLQEKVQKEIREVVGANRMPGTEDQLRMPFTNAIIYEVQRHIAAGLETLPRATSCHTKFRGYTIPQGTTVIPVLTSVHFDPLQWETPDKFNPGHFLDEKGQFWKRDAFMPFSAGKRACPGEALARMEIFLFFSILLQNFTFQLVGDAKNMEVSSLILEFKEKNLYPSLKAIRSSL